MESRNLILTVAVILVILLAFIVAMALSGNNSFQNGQLYFEYPNAWSQDYITGNFSQGTIYSEVTLKSNFPGSYRQKIAQKTTVIEKNNYYYTIEYICLPSALNQTEEAYNQILQTFKIV
ncbi:MAG: hypothetical protein HY802_02885 [Methanobacterium sp.]|nr:hypothetical protein [Methanobacterium sp.]